MNPFQWLVSILRNTPSQQLLGACKRGDLEKVRSLLQQGVSADEARTLFGETCLVVAAQAGHTSIVPLLLTGGAKADLASKNGITALMAAARAGQAEVVRLLVSRGASTEVTDRNGGTALAAAVEAGADMISLLLQLGAAVRGEPGAAALLRAVERQDEAAVRLLLEAGAEPNQSGNGSGGIFAKALESGSKARIALMLVEAGARPDCKDARRRTLLHTAVSTSVESAEALLERVELIQKMIERGADPNAADVDGQTPLVSACYGSERWKDDVVRALVKAGANPNARDNYGRTALFAALSAGGEAAARRIPVINALLESGADISGKDNDGSSVSDLALRLEFYEVFERLARHAGISNDGIRKLIDFAKKQRQGQG